MTNNKHLCDGNNISVYSKPSSDKTMDQVVFFEQMKVLFANQKISNMVSKVRQQGLHTWIPYADVQVKSVKYARDCM
jgi:hypothetical protein